MYFETCVSKATTQLTVLSYGGHLNLEELGPSEALEARLEKTEQAWSGTA